MAMHHSLPVVRRSHLALLGGGPMTRGRAGAASGSFSAAADGASAGAGGGACRAANEGGGGGGIGRGRALGASSLGAADAGDAGLRQEGGCSCMSGPAALQRAGSYRMLVLQCMPCRFA